jgi:hypothetical protein
VCLFFIHGLLSCLASAFMGPHRVFLFFIYAEVPA